jgi:hypothetical protein
LHDGVNGTHYKEINYSCALTLRLHRNLESISDTEFNKAGKDTCNNLIAFCLQAVIIKDIEFVKIAFEKFLHCTGLPLPLLKLLI